MAQKLAFVNNKGGSSKTTTAVNVAGAIHLRNKKLRILVVDGDGQGNATRSFNVDPNNVDTSIYDVFMSDVDPEDVIIKDVIADIDLLPANQNMNFIEFDKMKTFENDFAESAIKLIKLLWENKTDISNESDEDLMELLPKDFSPTQNYFNLLEGKFDNLDEIYDFILFDTPPELKAVTSSIIAITDKLIIPYEPDGYSMDGILNILERSKRIGDDFNPNLQIGGLLATKVKKNTKLHADVMLTVNNYANMKGIPFFSTTIPNTIRFSSATAYGGAPATLSKKTNDLINTYFNLVDEMANKGIIDLKISKGVKPNGK